MRFLDPRRRLKLWATVGAAFITTLVSSSDMAYGWLANFLRDWGILLGALGSALIALNNYLDTGAREVQATDEELVDG
jgi:hypothetical protein